MNLVRDEKDAATLIDLPPSLPLDPDIDEGDDFVVFTTYPDTSRCTTQRLTKKRVTNLISQFRRQLD